MAKSKIQIIEETVEHYQKHPRAIRRLPSGSLAGCYYFKPGEPDCQCAVGRCLTITNPIVLQMKQGAKGGKAVGSDTSTVNGLASTLVDSGSNLDKALKPAYRGHAVEFWRDLQSLHDSDTNWNGQNLTEMGMKNIKSLKQRYQDGKED